jgi:leader peptidase (prepilin peptidase)/N-methyltransferase
MVTDAAPAWSLPVAVAVAAVIGRLVTAGVLRLLEELESMLASSEDGAAESVALKTLPREKRPVWQQSIPILGWWFARRSCPRGWKLAAGIELASVVLGSLWWGWEVHFGMQLPQGLAGVVAAREPLLPRLLAHLVLAGFLTAATWCDLRYRLIPDAITVPGVLLGMLTVALLPDILLPVSCVIPVWAPDVLALPDVLGLAGPLDCQAASGWPVDLGGWPGLAGLVAGFTLWWSVGTAADPRVRWFRDPRLLVLIGGVIGVTAVWWFAAAEQDDRRLLALASSIVGILGSGGLIVLTREAASRALGREAMGLGDATLMAMVGAWLGWQIGVIAFFMAVFLGLAHGCLGWLRHRESELAFGPSLCAGTVLVLVGWRWVWAAVEPVFLEPLDLLAVLAVVVLLTGLTLAIWGRLRRDSPPKG